MAVLFFGCNPSSDSNRNHIVFPPVTLFWAGFLKGAREPDHRSELKRDSDALVRLDVVADVTADGPVVTYITAPVRRTLDQETVMARSRTDVSVSTSLVN